VPTEVVAHEVYAQVSTPMLWRFIQEMPARGDQWAADLIQRLRHNCGHELPALWKVKLDRDQAPALDGWLAEGRVVLGDLLRSPEDRERRLRVVPLLLLRDGEAVLTPDGETVLARDDELLFAGHSSERRELESTPGGRLDWSVRAVRSAHSIELGLAHIVPEEAHAEHV
jgi:hypothetical protein